MTDPGEGEFGEGDFGWRSVQTEPVDPLVSDAEVRLEVRAVVGLAEAKTVVTFRSDSSERALEALWKAYLEVRQRIDLMPILPPTDTRDDPIAPGEDEQ
jgi:hypothetical protein